MKTNKFAILWVLLTGSLAAFASQPIHEYNEGSFWQSEAAVAKSTKSDQELGLMVLYTQGALEHGGAGNLSSYIDTQVKTLQDAFASAGSANTVKLVHTERWSDSFGAIDDKLNTEALGRVISDGVFSPRNIILEGVWPAKMQSVGADYLVVIKTSGEGDSCGLSYVSTKASTLEATETNPFAHVQNVDNCANQTLAHELGHVFGGNHVKGEASISDYAYSDSCGGKGTIMNIENVGNRHSMYSTPGTTIDGDACGSEADANMAKVILDYESYAVGKSAAVASDEASVVGFAETSFSVDESSGVTTLQVTRSNPSSSAVVYVGVSNGSASDADYSLSATTLDFAEGVDSLSFDVTIVDDSAQESDETFDVRLSTLAVNARIDDSSGAASFTIKSNDSSAGGGNTGGGNTGGGNTGGGSSDSSGGGSTTLLLILLLSGLVLFRRRITD